MDDNLYQFDRRTDAICYLPRILEIVRQAYQQKTFIRIIDISERVFILTDLPTVRVYEKDACLH